MCGIIGYVGKKPAADILIEGLKTLEYRGYDSAGIYISGECCIRSVDGIDALYKKLPQCTEGTAGIAHTRWATHGLPIEKNAHPHRDCTKSLWLVHNGIIENYKELTLELTKGGHSFSSKTDSEVLVHLIEESLKKTNCLKKAVVEALQKVRGTYGIAVMHKDFLNEIIVARMGSPIVLGIGKDEYFVASDPSAILRHTNNMLYLEDGECARITSHGYEVFSHTYKKIQKDPEEVDLDIDDVQKEGYEHFMLKEIMEVPQVLVNSARGRIDLEHGTAHLGGIEDVARELQKTKRIIIVACGSTYYAGIVGKYILEEYAGVSVEVEIASEFRYKTIPHNKDTLVLAISQSGETADTLACVKEAKRKGLLTLGIVNTVGSTIARETDAGIYNHAGPEISVASTKAFLSQIEVLVLLAIFLGRQRNLTEKEGREILTELMKIPKKVERILKQKNIIKKIAKKYAKYRDFLFIGRKYNFAIAYEGALKLKEISYIHAEGYGAGEMKHGPLAMIDKDFPTVAIVPKDSVYEKTISNIEEIKARNGKVLAIATEKDKGVVALASDVIYIPKTIEVLSPLLTVMPLHLLSYYIGVAKGHNVDRPRNLAKSVTVE